MKKPIVISMSGKLGSGKDTFARYLEDVFIEQKCFDDPQDTTLVYDVQLVAFATYFKETLSSMFHIGLSYFYDREKKEQILPGMLVSPRELMIRFSDFVRACKPDHFVQEGKERILSACRGATLSTRRIVIVTDTRMPLEFKMLDELHREGIATVIRILVNRDTGISSVADSHESEVTISNIKDWDYIVENNGTLEDLKQLAEEIIEDILIEESIQL